MCGIVGGTGKHTYQTIKATISLLDRRGPDHCQVVNFKNGLSLGSTRLAMTDPHERSNQPMIDEVSGDVLVFNGQIYNYKSLKKVLLNHKIGFRTESDTEVLLKGLIHYDLTCIADLEGMFAFAYYNKKKNQLILARDYLGKKPLFYAVHNDFFIFSSRVEVVKKFLINLTLDQNSIINFLSLGYLLDPGTMYNEIKSVEPGEILIFDLYTSKITSKHKFVPNTIKNSTELNLKKVFDESVSQRVDGHNSCALSLSGGIDSNIILLRCLKAGIDIKPFTVRWSNADKPRYNFDSDSAIAISKKLNLNLNVVEMPDARSIPNLLTKFVKAMDEPNSNPSGLSMMVLYDAIKSSGDRLVLTGDGSDEIFGGYRRYELTQRMRKIPKLGLGKKFILNNGDGNGLISKFALAFETTNSPEFWLYWHLIASRITISKYYEYSPIINIPDLTSGLTTRFGHSTTDVRELMFTDLKIWLTMESNRKLDRISMWHSIEARSPFQSEKVIGTGYALMKQNSFQLVNKQILKSYFPEIKKLPTNTNKMGFISPLGFWLRNNPDLVKSSIDNLCKVLPFNKKNVSQLSESPNLGNYNDFKLLWSLVVLNFWINENH